MPKQSRNPQTIAASEVQASEPLGVEATKSEQVFPTSEQSRWDASVPSSGRNPRSADFTDDPDSFPDLEFAKLKTQAELWGESYPLIQRIILYRNLPGHSDEPIKYILAVEVPGLNGDHTVKVRKVMRKWDPDGLAYGLLSDDFKSYFGKGPYEWMIFLCEPGEEIIEVSEEKCWLLYQRPNVEFDAPIDATATESGRFDLWAEISELEAQIRELETGPCQDVARKQERIEELNRRIKEKREILDHPDRVGETIDNSDESVPQPVPCFSFYQEGDYWRIGIPGEEEDFAVKGPKGKDRAGFRRLHYMLGRPRENIDLSEFPVPVTRQTVIKTINSAISEIVARLPYIGEYLFLESSEHPKIISISKCDCWYKPNKPVNWILESN